MEIIKGVQDFPDLPTRRGKRPITIRGPHLSHARTTGPQPKNQFEKRLRRPGQIGIDRSILESIGTELTALV
jgi:hypothetical protein